MNPIPPGGLDSLGEEAWIEVIRKMDEVYSELLQYEVAGVVEDACGRMIVHGLQESLEGRAVMQVFARMDFVAQRHVHLGKRIERRPPRLDMSVYPYLPHASVALTSARTYMDLLTGVTS